MLTKKELENKVQELRSLKAMKEDLYSMAVKSAENCLCCLYVSFLI